jgi:hypothetical protein
LPTCSNDGNQPVAVVLDLSCSQPMPVGGFAAEVTICNRRDSGRSARTAAGGMLRFGMGDASIDGRTSGLQPSLVDNGEREDQVAEDRTYRGYLLQVSPQGPGWKVVIRAPGAWFAHNQIPYTRDPDGRDQVVVEAERAVDGLLNSE